jgi:hypothetical protein
MMSVLNFELSVERAARRLGHTGPRRRSDAGTLRLAPTVQRALRALVLGQERPRMADLKRALDERCRRAGERAPSRATLYQALWRLEGHAYEPRRLPAAVRRVLYNLDPAGAVPGHQLAFYCFNYGTLDAVSFAAGLPWLDLYQAARLSGWRPRSQGLLIAVMRVRGIA